MQRLLRTGALAVAASVAIACSGSIDGQGSSGSPEDGSAPIDHMALDGGGDATAPVVSLRCPAAQPAAGTVCDPNPAPLQCEYGGDTYGRCTTIADCARDSGASEFTWHLVTSSSCIPTNPAACPSTYGGLAEGSACPGAPTMACDYDEGRCGCVCDGQAYTWKCRARVDFPSTVTSAPPPDPLPVCSAHRPLLGTACSVEGEQCGYATYCAPAFSFGPSEECRNGVWVLLPNNGACAASTCP